MKERKSLSFSVSAGGPRYTPASSLHALSQELGRLLADDDVAERVREVGGAAAGVPDELGGGEEVAVAHAHDAHVVRLAKLVQEPVDAPRVGALQPGGHHRHLLHHRLAEVVRARGPHRRQRAEGAQRLRSAAVRQAGRPGGR
jgi:hypothetical protein